MIIGTLILFIIIVLIIDCVIISQKRMGFFGTYQKTITFAVIKRFR